MISLLTFSSTDLVSVHCLGMGTLTFVCGGWGFLPDIGWAAVGLFSSWDCLMHADTEHYATRDITSLWFHARRETCLV
jgi:hypothetical protein